MSKVIVYRKNSIYNPFFVFKRGMIFDVYSASYNTTDNIFYTLYRVKAIYDGSIFETSMDSVMPYVNGINYDKIYHLIDLEPEDYYSLANKIQAILSRVTLYGYESANNEINKMIMERACA